MSLIALASVSGAPGVTTTAVGLALSRPRATVLVEADGSRPSSVLPGLLRGQADHSRGLTEIAVADQRGALSIELLWGQMLPLAESRYLVPGFAQMRAAHGMSPAFWARFASVLAELEPAGVDAIVDLGRIQPDDPRLALLTASDAVLVLARPVLPDIAALAAHRTALTAALDAVGRGGTLALVLAGGAREAYSAAEVSHNLRWPVIASLPVDVRTAEHFALGTASARRLDRAPLGRALVVLDGAIDKHVHSHRTQLGLPVDEAVIA